MSHHRCHILATTKRTDCFKSDPMVSFRYLKKLVLGLKDEDKGKKKRKSMTKDRNPKKKGVLSIEPNDENEGDDNHEDGIDEDNDGDGEDGDNEIQPIEGFIAQGPVYNPAIDVVLQVPAERDGGMGHYFSLTKVANLPGLFMSCIAIVIGLMSLLGKEYEGGSFRLVMPY